MTKKKWYVVTVGKNIGVFDTWLETASLTKQVPNATFQGFDTEKEARHAFRKAQENGTTRIVGNANGSFQPTMHPLVPMFHEDSPRGHPIPLVISQSQQRPRHSSSSRTPPPSPPPIMHANVTYTRGPPSSPNGSSRSSRRMPPRMVVVDTPPYLNSYPNDTEETPFQQGVDPTRQSFSSPILVNTGPQLSSHIMDRTSPSMEFDHNSGGSRSSNRARTPLSSRMVPIPPNASPPIRPNLPFAGLTPSTSTSRCIHTCPHCGPMIPLSRSRTPQSDPRSPILQMTSLTGQLNYLLYGRPSPPLTVED